MNEIQHASKIPGVRMFTWKRRHDKRGFLLELFRIEDDLTYHQPAMAYISVTEPDVIRGPHEHVNQTDYFVFITPGAIELHLWDNRGPGRSLPPNPLHHEIHSPLYSQDALAVIVPPGVIHAYRNIASVPAFVFNAPDTLYAGKGYNQPVDEIRYEDRPDVKEWFEIV